MSWMKTYLDRIIPIYWPLTVDLCSLGRERMSTAAFQTASKSQTVSKVSNIKETIWSGWALVHLPFHPLIHIAHRCFSRHWHLVCYWLLSGVCLFKLIELLLFNSEIQEPPKTWDASILQVSFVSISCLEPWSGWLTLLLDVDELDDVDKLEEHITKSAVVICSIWRLI